MLGTDFRWISIFSSISTWTSVRHADTLSRLPLPESPQSVPLPGDLKHLTEQLSESIVTSTQIKDWSNKDPLLSRVRNFILTGWPIMEPEPGIQPYYQLS